METKMKASYASVLKMGSSSYKKEASCSTSRTPSMRKREIGTELLQKISIPLSPSSSKLPHSMLQSVYIYIYIYICIQFYLAYTVQNLTIIFFFFSFIDSSTKDFIDRTCSGMISFYAPLQIKFDFIYCNYDWFWFAYFINHQHLFHETFWTF